MNKRRRFKAKHRRAERRFWQDLLARPARYSFWQRQPVAFDPADLEQALTDAFNACKKERFY